MKTATRMLRLTPAIVAATLLLTACAPVLNLEPAEDAENTACADVIVGLRDLDVIGDLSARETNAQGTAAWGEPAGIILRCGVPTPPPTSESPCATVDDVDWLRDDTDDPNFVFTTYGRTPAIEVIIDSDGDPDNPDDGVSGVEALTELAAAVALVPATSQCTTPTG